MNNNNNFGTEKISSLLLKLAPPVMLAQLIQALYNIVDSYYIGKFSTNGLAALSVLFPIQLLIIALAVGTGVGVNTIISKFDGLGKSKLGNETATCGLILSIISWAVFALISWFAMDFYTTISLETPLARQYACTYGKIVCCLSFGLFLESCFTKILQARGDMKTPMIAQIVGAVTNIILDYFLIFGVGIFPKLGITGAAVATVIGQVIAAIIVGLKALHSLSHFCFKHEYVKDIYHAGIPHIIMEALCTVYIVVFNLILVKYGDDAVTVLGLYYKLQSFCLIPVMGLATCIVPLLSYNYAAKKFSRCKTILWDSVIISAVCLGIGTLAFEVFPTNLLNIFVNGQANILQIGTIALRIIGISFIPIAFTVIFPTYFQAIGMAKESISIAIIRQLCLLIPLGFIFSLIGLNFFWLAFPVTEIMATVACLVLYVTHRI